MKRKPLVQLLIGEGIVFFISALLIDRFPLMISSGFSFPFEQIAAGLKYLSNMGRLANGLAIALWVGISLFPLIFIFKSKTEEKKESSVQKSSEQGNFEEKNVAQKSSKQRFAAQEIAAYAFSFLLFLALYAMINPELLSSGIFDKKIKLHSVLVNCAIGASLWSLIILYYVICLIQTVRFGNQNSLLKHIRIILHVLCLIFMGSMVIPFTKGLISSFQTQMPFLDKGFDIMRLIVASIPNVFYIAMIVQAFILIDFFVNEEERIADVINRLRKICIIGLLSMVAFNTGFNFFQLYFLRSLSHFQISVELPIVDIAFMAIVLLSCKLLLENKELRDENNLFV